MLAETFFTLLLKRDASGREWLGRLLCAAPQARERLHEMAEAPGSLSMSLSVHGISGRLGAFEYPLAPSPALTRWLIDHPDALSWPEGAQMSQGMRRLRQALLFDQPPGARAKAQERARELLGARSVLSEEWWRFEEMGTLDALLMTDRVVITIDGGVEDPGQPATPWFPARSRLVRSLEAARQLAEGRRWGCLLMTDSPLDVEAELLSDDALAAGAPHLESAARSELRQGYLGNLTWSAATQAVGLSA